MTDNAKTDLLHGIKAIAEHVGITERQARHRSDLGQLPTFKLGRTICAKRSAIDAWLCGLAIAARKVPA